MKHLAMKHCGCGYWICGFQAARTFGGCAHRRRPGAGASANQALKHVMLSAASAENISPSATSWRHIYALDDNARGGNDDSNPIAAAAAATAAATATRT